MVEIELLNQGIHLSLSQTLFAIGVAILAHRSQKISNQTMRKLLFTQVSLGLLSTVLLISCATESGSSDVKTRDLESPSISVQVLGAPTESATLIGIYGDQNFVQDSASIDRNGALLFQRDEPYPPGLYYVLLPDQRYFQCLIDEDQTFSMQTQARDLNGQMKIEGSVDNELLYQSLAFESKVQLQIDEVTQKLRFATEGTGAYDQLKEQQDQLIAERNGYLEDLFERNPNTLFTVFKKAGQNPEVRDVRRQDGSTDTDLQIFLYRSEFWDNVDFSDDRLIRTPVIFNKLRRHITELTAQNADSIKKSSTVLMNKVLEYPEYFKFFANWIAVTYEPRKTTLMDSEAVYVHFVQNYFTHERAVWSDSLEIVALHMRADEMAASLIGKKGPNVTANDPEGRPQSIYDIQSPYIIVYLYNPDCDHCIEETPKLVSFYREWKPKGVEVYAIALDVEDQKWKDFIASNGMDWVNVYDPTNQAIYATYFVDNTPEIYVLNPDRTIIGKNLKVHQIETIIQRDQEI